MNDLNYWQNYRIKIYPTEDQKERIFDIINIFRYCYNWGIATCNRLYEETGKSTTKFSLAREFTEFRHQPGNEWLLKYDITTCRFALWNVVEAFNLFFEGRTRYPVFKSKKHMRKHTFQIRGERVKFYENGKYAHLPGITKDGIRMLCKRHRIPTGNNVEYKNVYVTYLANEFWLSLSVCARRPIYSDNAEGLLDAPLGIDVGIRRAAILSDGTMYDPPNHNRSKMLRNRISKLISVVQRDTRERFKQSIRTKTKYENIPKSKNQLKRIDKMRKTYRDIVNLYQGRYHQISADIVKKNPSFVVLENISVTQLCKHDKFLTDELTQARLGVLIHYIKYKCEKNGIPVILAPKYYPSSQICSNCGNRHKPGKSVVYTCPHCGITIDRDINAARNLLDYGERSIMARI